MGKAIVKQSTNTTPPADVSTTASDSSANSESGTNTTTDTSAQTTQISDITTGN